MDKDKESDAVVRPHYRWALVNITGETIDGQTWSTRELAQEASYKEKQVSGKELTPVKVLIVPVPED